MGPGRGFKFFFHLKTPFYDGMRKSRRLKWAGVGKSRRISIRGKLKLGMAVSVLEFYRSFMPRLEGRSAKVEDFGGIGGVSIRGVFVNREIVCLYNSNDVKRLYLQISKQSHRGNSNDSSKYSHLEQGDSKGKFIGQRRDCPDFHDRGRGQGDL